MIFGIYETKFAYIKIAVENNKVVLIKPVDSLSLDNKNELTDLAIKEIKEYFEAERREFTFPYEIRGTEFQKKVYTALLNIKYGQVKTYKDIAKEIGNDKACRAVGNANNKNPLMFVVPCHRVIGQNGNLTGYAGGLEMKKALLELEKTN